RALTSQLRQLAERADGVRCDMAMLLLNRIFQEVWGADNPGPCPDEEFWATAIAAVKAERPDFLFLAEAYWGTEPELHGLGFDYTYDKSLYDRLLHAGAAEVRAHILAQGDALGRGIH